VSTSPIAIEDAGHTDGGGGEDCVLRPQPAAHAQPKGLGCAQRRYLEVEDVGRGVATLAAPGRMVADARPDAWPCSAVALGQQLGRRVREDDVVAALSGQPAARCAENPFQIATRLRTAIRERRTTRASQDSATA
jgi:hypothetical protein